MTTLSAARSSFMLQITHNPESEELTVVMKSGARYKYYGVTKQKFARFKSAASFGSYFATHIRGKYPVRRTRKANVN